jgi:hypothetical protein
MPSRFIDDHPGELLILDIGDDCGFDTDNGYPRLTNDQWDPIIQDFADGLKGYTCNIDDDVNTAVLKNHVLNDFIGDGKGCVLPVIRITGYDETKWPGFWPYAALPRLNSYASTIDIGILGRDQIGKLRQNRVLGAGSDSGTKDDLMVFSWTLTPTPLDFPIWQGAGEAFPQLAGWAYSYFTPFSFPNILLVDFIGVKWDTDNPLGPDQAEQISDHTNMDIVGLALAVNLGIASQNCYVGGGGVD